jgi:hypothetical protein
MKSAIRMTAIALAGTLFAGVAFAQAQGSSGGGPSGTTGSAPSGTKSKSDQGVPPGTSTKPGTTTSPASPSASPSTSPASSAGDFMGRHTMTGEVTKIDNKKGMFSLKTKEGTLDLHAPPSALQGVKRGDQVAVEIAFKPMK